MEHESETHIRYSPAAYDTLSRKIARNTCYSALGGKNIRHKFMISIGVDPFNIGEVKGDWGHKIMSFLMHFIGLIPYVGSLIKLFFERCVRSIEDVVETILFCEENNIPEILFPTTHEEIMFVIYLANIQLNMRLRPKAQVVASWTPEQVARFEDSVVNKQQRLLGYCLIRLLGIGSSPHKVKIPFCYNYGVGCLYGCNVNFHDIYGGSKGMAKTTCEAIINANISYDEASYTLDNYDSLWRQHLIDLLEEAKKQASLHNQGAPKLVVKKPVYRPLFTSNVSVDNSNVVSIAMTERSLIVDNVGDLENQNFGDAESGCIPTPLANCVMSPFQEINITDSLSDDNVKVEL